MLSLMTTNSETLTKPDTPISPQLLPTIDSDRVLHDSKKARVSDTKINGTDSRVSEFASAYSTADEGAEARRSEAFGPEASMALSYGFEPGDMVWGKVKSHPWWPGHIFSEAFASPSVRKTKRAGHLLVAFFGDSSYGWFDPAELIPFEPNFAEKSMQTVSRGFVKAVDEAVDEASRRGGLGLTCMCRNGFNFRPTNVRGYFAVDVAGYEPGGVYSVQQIKKARDAFSPADTLSFVRELAASPGSFDRWNFQSVQNRAKVCAFRKAVYEEFDETYAQAFGMQPLKPSPDSKGAVDMAGKVSVKAPLSGPMVTAEVLGEKKSTTKPMKVKDQSKKDKYLFKRRDDPNNLRSTHVSQGGASVSTSFACKEEIAVVASKDHVIPTRASLLPTTTDEPAKQRIGTMRESSPLIQGGRPRYEAASADRKSIASEFDLVDIKDDMGLGGLPTDPPANHLVAYGGVPVIEGDAEGGKSRLDEEKFSAPNGTMSSGEDPGSTSTGIDILDNRLKEDTNTVDLQQQMSKLEGSEEQKEGLEIPVGVHSAPGKVWDGVGTNDISHSVARPALLLDGILSGRSGDNAVKKKKVLKRSLEEINSERSFAGEKKKRKKKEQHLESNSEHSQKRRKAAKDGEIRKKSAGKSVEIGLVPSEKLQLDPQRKNDDDAVTLLSSDSASAVTKIDLQNIEVEIPELVSDLLALALDPFHGIERNSPEIVRQVLLRFRSLVYQKSLVLVPPSEAETLEEGFVTKSPFGAGENASGEGVGDRASKHVKALNRPDDPTKAGRKRSLSGRQEEMSAKRMKKVNELKSTIAEKKGSNLKSPEVQRELKETRTSAVVATSKHDSIKKLAPAARVSQPAMLVMKFPPRTNLPSSAELKARFARFGPLDHSGMRVFFKTSTCRVVFKEKLHAQAAYEYAIGNKTFFGQVNVNYYLKDLGPAEGPETTIRRLDGSFEPGQSIGESRQIAIGNRTSQATTQLKSCLKKPSGDEVSPAIARETPRVKFMLGGEESSREEQSMVSVNTDYNQNSNGGASSSLAMDVNTKNFQKVFSQPPPSVILPFPPPRNIDMHESRGVGHFFKASLAPPPPPHYNEVVAQPPLPYHTESVAPPPPPLHYNEVVEPLPKYNNYKVTSTSTSSNMNKNNNNDVSQQMLSLLMRCNDIVTDVNRKLGYVPYHPL